MVNSSEMQRVALWCFDGVTGPNTGWGDALATVLARRTGVVCVDPYVDDPFETGAFIHVLSGGATSVGDTPESTKAFAAAKHLVSLVRAGEPYSALGVCLGSQMLAAAVADRVVSGPVERGVEVGVVEVADRRGCVHRVPTFHSHSVHPEFGDLTGVEVLASNAHSAIQAWRWRSVTGLQFHPELSKATLTEAVRANPAWVQDPDGTCERIVSGPSPDRDRVDTWLLQPLGL